MCYARAVRGPGWDAVGSGRELSGAVCRGQQLDRHGPARHAAEVPADGHRPSVFGTITSLDRQRGDTRRRLALAKPGVPTVISAFMLALVFLTVSSLAFFIPRVDNTALRVALLVACSVLVLSLALIRSLDRPFSGVLKIEPTAMSITADDITGGHDMCIACVMVWRMPKMIQVRDVPDEVHRTLKIRAAAAGMSLSDYVKRDLELAASRPTLDELDARARERGPSRLRTETIVSTLRELRDA